MTAFQPYTDQLQSGEWFFAIAFPDGRLMAVSPTTYPTWLDAQRALNMLLQLIK
jgi:hypothetical protein